MKNLFWINKPIIRKITGIEKYWLEFLPRSSQCMINFINFLLCKNIESITKKLHPTPPLFLFDLQFTCSKNLQCYKSTILKFYIHCEMLLYYKEVFSILQRKVKNIFLSMTFIWKWWIAPVVTLIYIIT